MKTVAAILLFTFVRCATAQQPPVDQAQIDGVRILATVRTRRGESVVGIQASQLRVREAGNTTKVASISRIAEPQIGDYCVVFDLGDEGDWMFNLQSDAATEVLKTVVRPHDAGSLVLVTASASMPVRLSATDIQKRIDGAAVLRWLVPRGDPPVYSAMLECGDRLSRSRADGVRAMFVFTGQRVITSPKLNEVSRLALKAGVMLYVVHVARPDTRDSRTFDNLAKVAVATGGSGFECVAKNDVKHIADEIHDDFQNLFSICYRPARPAPAQADLYSFDFVADEQYKVTAPAAYYWPNPESRCRQ